MIAFTPYVPILWIFIGLVLFARGPRPLAVVIICLLGTLFLPELQSSPVAKDALRPIRVPLLEFSKVNAMAYALLLGLILFDAPRIAQVRWSIFDLPALMMGTLPAISTLLNGNTTEMAFAELRASFLVWTAPYLVGRVYLSDYWGIRLVTTAFVAGGLLYIPFCLLEMRFSPQLHYRVFGFQQHEFAQTVRLGGYRPMVFMQHGLAVGLWMVSASLCLFWLWRTGGWPTPRTPMFLRRIPGFTVLAQAGTSVFCKSSGAVVLGISGLATLLASTRWHTRLLLMILLFLPPAYVTSRLAGWWRSQDLVNLIGKSVQEERSKSLEFRLYSEEVLMRMAKDHTWHGMGGGAHSRPKDDEGRPIIPDGQWIITYYDTGVIGVAAFLALILGPALRFVVLHPPATWGLPQIAPATVAAVVLGVVACDCMFNAMLNPMYFLLMAALNGWNDGAGDPRSQLTLRYLADPASFRVA